MHTPFLASLLIQAQFLIYCLPYLIDMEAINHLYRLAFFHNAGRSRFLFQNIVLYQGTVLYNETQTGKTVIHF